MRVRVCARGLTHVCLQALQHFSGRRSTAFTACQRGRFGFRHLFGASVIWNLNAESKEVYRSRGQKVVWGDADEKEVPEILPWTPSSRCWSITISEREPFCNYIWDCSTVLLTSALLSTGPCGSRVISITLTLPPGVPRLCYQMLTS